MWFGQNVLRMSWKERFAQFSWKAHCFPVLKRIWGQFLEFENFDGEKRDLAQNVLRMTWKERFVQFLWKAHCFPFFRRNLGRCDDFENFDGQNCDLAKTCCACPEKSVLYNFYGRRTLFLFWREFQATVRILRTCTVKNVIWPKPAPHDLKRAFCTIFIESALFSYFKGNMMPMWGFWPKKSVLRNFYEKRTVFPFWREI